MGCTYVYYTKNDNTVWFISDFRELNKRIWRQPYPITKIQDLLLSLEGFKYGTSLDLNMGYYHIELSAKSKELCTIVTQWSKYEYQRLPMGLCNSPDIFQEKMSELLAGLDTVPVYLDDILDVTKGSWEEHLAILEKIFIYLQKARLKVNAKKSSFWCSWPGILRLQSHTWRHHAYCGQGKSYTRNYGLKTKPITTRNP